MNGVVRFPDFALPLPYYSISQKVTRCSPFYRRFKASLDIARMLSESERLSKLGEKGFVLPVPTSILLDGFSGMVEARARHLTAACPHELLSKQDIEEQFHRAAGPSKSFERVWGVWSNDESSSPLSTLLLVRHPTKQQKPDASPSSRTPTRRCASLSPLPRFPYCPSCGPSASDPKNYHLKTFQRAPKSLKRSKPATTTTPTSSSSESATTRRSLSTCV